MKTFMDILFNAKQDKAYGNYFVEVISQNGKRVLLRFYLRGTCIAEVNLISETYKIRNGGWNTMMTCQAMIKCCKFLEQLGFVLVDVDVIGVEYGYIPDELLLFQETKDKGVNMITNKDKVICCYHRGNSGCKLKSMPTDELVVVPPNITDVNRIVPYCELTGKNLKEIAENIGKYKRTLEVNIDYAVSPKGICYGLWKTKKNETVVFKLRLRAVVFNYNHTYCKTTYTAESMYWMDDETKAMIFWMGIEGTTINEIDSRFHLFKEIAY